MSGIAVIFNRNDAPAETGALSPVIERLQHRGPDGCDVTLTGALAIGHCHFWTTPEEVGEKQPVRLPGLPYMLAFDGRLDNRAELLAALGLQDTQMRILSDAAVVLKAYRRWGEGCFVRLIGPFALVLWDEQNESLFLARDALGDRSLFYSLDEHRLVAASEAWAVAGYPGMQAGLDDIALAHYFAVSAPPDGRSFFTGIYELLPARVMKIVGQEVRTWRYWQPTMPDKHVYQSDFEYAEQFRALLEESVRCRLRSITPAGVLLSGGLDSSSVVALAASLVAPQPLTTLTYVFDELPDCDERRYIGEMQSCYAIQSLQFSGDGAWPMRDWENWPFNPETPTGNAYNLLKEGVYKHARQAGMKVLLDGEFGDNLYGLADDWLADLLVDRRLWDAGQEIFRHFHYFGLADTLKSSFLWRLGRRGLNRLTGRNRFFSPHRLKRQPWLTPFTVSCLEKNAFTHVTNSSLDGFEPDIILGLFESKGFSSEISLYSRFGIEMRHPYRDRRLVEFVLALPAYQLHSHCWHRYILRTAMQGLLPDGIRSREDKTTFVSLFSRGFEREKGVVEACLENKQAPWRKFVRSEWLLPYWSQHIHHQPDSVESLVLWFCISASAWINKHNQ